MHAIAADSSPAAWCGCHSLLATAATLPVQLHVVELMPKQSIDGPDEASPLDEFIGPDAPMRGGCASLWKCLDLAWIYLQIWRPLVSSFLMYFRKASLDSHAAGMAESCQLHCQAMSRKHK